MNRVRQYKNVYQVLLTPHHRFDSGMELMYGAWSDDHLKNYSIKQFQTVEEAMAVAFDHPDINWNMLVEFHKDIYAKLHKIIKSTLDEYDFMVEYQPVLMSPTTVKNMMFDRVMMNGERFKLNYNLNDIIGFHIINPWSKNLVEIFHKLKQNSSLRIERYEHKNNVIHMIGKTDSGTNYEIVLWPTLVAQWAKWCMKHPDVPQKSKEQSLKDILTVQQSVEQCVALR